MSTRFRLRYTFWLDMAKADEQALAETIENLKARRAFARTVREGIRLICELREGSIELLLKLFPFVKEAVRAEVESDIRQELAEERLQKLVDEFRAMMVQGPGVRVSKPLTDDLEIDVKKAKTDGKQAAENFLRAMNALNPPKKKPEVGPKVMDVPQFESPDFDDLSL